MLRRILVGFDGSVGSRDALALARSLAAADRASLSLLACVGDVSGTGSEEGLAAAARELLGGRQHSLRVIAGVPAPKALVEAAAEAGADAIVIGSTHRGALGRVLPGSVGERLLQGAPCAVVVAPRDYAGRNHFGIGELGVGYDGRPEARDALHLAASLASDLGASLRLIAADRPIEPHDLLPGDLPPTREELDAALERALAALGDEVDASAEVVSGPPATVLAERGVELDLLVIGSRGYGPVRHTLLGGVSAEVARTAPCPVMVVPRSAGEARPGEG